MKTAIAGLLTCAVGALMWVSPLQAAAAIETAAQPSASAETQAQAQRQAPRYISGYSYHCSQEMANDNITGPEADSLVQNYWLSATYQEKDPPESSTWRYDGPNLAVILNLNGWCVTAFRY